MEVSAVEKLLTDKLENVEVLAQTDGHHYQVRVVGEVFDGLNAVKRQQLIYGCLNEHILDGTIHAVVIKTYTPSEWQQAQQ